jgi:hypothetical protein
MLGVLLEYPSWLLPNAERFGRFWVVPLGDGRRLRFKVEVIAQRPGHKGAFDGKVQLQLVEGDEQMLALMSSFMPSRSGSREVTL